MKNKEKLTFEELEGVLPHIKWQRSKIFRIPNTGLDARYYEGILDCKINSKGLKFPKKLGIEIMVEHKWESKEGWVAGEKELFHQQKEFYHLYFRVPIMGPDEVKVFWDKENISKLYNKISLIYEGKFQ